MQKLPTSIRWNWLGKRGLERTKAALAAAKARGVRLGKPNGAADIAGRYRRQAVAALKAGADERLKGLALTIAGIRAEGVESADAIAAELNGREIATPRGGKWSARSVLNVLARL